ncbi:translocation and assembly module lipoprotein TamL [Snuella sedimenti]|uniref:BamA/TamA family outer membrane protein n=1 Tax=Snuella sedimenti TaxID=2798802 RepID=A0A8J7IFG7_9FLAO|nr:BamA/TamA family outer membrane protein [Snuella sedimenti]MBJ6367832.1 BamA/TamA family outer membrane protein [Snuella sedimenti]
MKQQLFKILILIIITGFIFSCNAVKRVPQNEYLLTNTSIEVNNKKDNTETLSNLLYQEPNKKILGFPLRLHLYNTARPNIDSIIEASINKNPKRKSRYEKFLSKKQLERYRYSRINFNNWIKKTGEAPVIVDKNKTEKSVKRLHDYYINNGWFDVKASSIINKEENNRATIDYHIETGTPFILDSISQKIASPVIDSLYYYVKKNTLLIPKEQYRTENFELERERITNALRNSGVYHFNQDYIGFEIDTIGTNKKVNVDVQIQNRAIRTQDSIKHLPFQIYKVKDVKIITNYRFAKEGQAFQDSLFFNGYNIYSYDKIRYRPKALTDAVFISPNSIFKDIDRTRTYRHISELRSFKYPDIKYDSITGLKNQLATTIKLTPLKKFSLSFDTDISQSNIQTIGLALNPSLLIRNIFRGAETFEISAIGSIGSSKDENNPDDPFFDINEIGVDLKLTIPRLFSPFNTDKIIPKHMSPSTRISLSASGQTNIGLDKQAFSGTFNYNWRPSNKTTNRLDLFNAQYVRNLNVDNYFDVYKNSYNTLNAISKLLNYNNGEDLERPDQTDTFITEVLNDNTSLNPEDDDYKRVSAINERKNRLTENNLILSSSFSLIRDDRTNLFDEDFSIFRFKLESAGNLLANASKLLGLKKNSDDRYELFNVAYSQYIKTELEYIKHWDLGKKNVLALRSFFGIAIPYGNSTNIPFSKSFFAGGSNDNRAWTAYSLGPGSSETTNEFNEANLKLALSIEQRFNIFENLNGAIFVDAGNIWNVLDEIEEERATFTDFNSLKDTAIGSGFGLRYDFSFFVFRFDVGFKTYDPSYNTANRWFNDYNFSNAVYNIGINYPF